MKKDKKAPKIKPVFLCHSHKDKEKVEIIAESLEKYGVKVWYDDWCIGVGDSIRQKLEEGIKESSWMAVILSKESVKSDWVNKEIDAGFEQEIQRKGIYILPLLIEDCEIPLFIKTKKYADFRSDHHQGLFQILEKILGKERLYREYKSSPLNPFLGQFELIKRKYGEVIFLVKNVRKTDDGFPILEIQSEVLKSDLYENYISLIKAYLSTIIGVIVPYIFVMKKNDKLQPGIHIDKNEVTLIPSWYVRGLEEHGPITISHGGYIKTDEDKCEFLIQLLISNTRYLKDRQYRLLTDKLETVANHMNGLFFKI